MNDSLLGIGVTTPMFTDGYVDKNPDWIGPKFSLVFEPFQLCHPRDDWCNHCYSSFLYVPNKFRLFPHGTQLSLTTDLDCLNHHMVQEK